MYTHACQVIHDSQHHCLVLAPIDGLHFSASIILFLKIIDCIGDSTLAEQIYYKMKKTVNVSLMEFSIVRVLECQTIIAAPALQRQRQHVKSGGAWRS